MAGTPPKPNDDVDGKNNDNNKGRKGYDKKLKTSLHTSQSRNNSLAFSKL
jgi:hypothetical protein